MRTDIEVTGLVRTFGQGSRLRRAVDNISFAVSSGQLFGVLGPNGAGKTTTIKILLTTLLPTEGAARVKGFDVVRDVKAVRRSIGCVLGGDKGFYDRLTARQNLTYFADLYRVPFKVQRWRLPEVLDMVGLADRSKDKVETFSRGMRQRLHIARSILHDPPVLILDEPTNGLDPVGARDIRQLAQDLVAAGRTILLTTHNMPEAEQLCQQLVVLVNGKIIAEGAPADIKGIAGARQVTELYVYGAEPDHLARLRDIPGVVALHVEVSGHTQVVQLQSRPGADCVPEAIQRLNGRVQRVQTREPTLEDAYLALVSGGDR